MNVVTRKPARRRRMTSDSRVKGETSLRSKKAAQTSAAEHQIAEVEQTFTDRWEW